MLEKIWESLKTPRIKTDQKIYKEMVSMIQNDNAISEDIVNNLHTLRIALREESEDNWNSSINNLIDLLDKQKTNLKEIPEVIQYYKIHIPQIKKEIEKEIEDEGSDNIKEQLLEITNQISETVNNFDESDFEKIITRIDELMIVIGKELNKLSKESFSRVIENLREYKKSLKNLDSSINLINKISSNVVYVNLMKYAPLIYAIGSVTVIVLMFDYDTQLMKFLIGGSAFLVGGAFNPQISEIYENLKNISKEREKILKLLGENIQ